MGVRKSSRALFNWCHNQPQNVRNQRNFNPNQTIQHTYSKIMNKQPSHANSRWNANSEKANTSILKSLKTAHSALKSIKPAENPFFLHTLKMQMNCLQMERSTKHFIEHQPGIKNITNSQLNWYHNQPQDVRNTRNFNPNQYREQVYSKMAYNYRNIAWTSSQKMRFVISNFGPWRKTEI